MKVSVEKLPSSEAVLEVDVTWDEMEKASEKAYRKLVRQVDIQGFRRGKAPRSLLERRLGKEYIYQEGLEDIISEAYRTAIKDHDLTPITQPKLDAPAFEMGQPYHFSLTVPIIIPVELDDYRSLHFEREDAMVTSEEVEKDIESQREPLAPWHEVQRPANYGDRITVDLKLSSEGQSISDLTDNPFELTNERHGLFTGMDEQVVGMQPGESKSFTTTIPADYSNEKLAGKQGDYEITLHKVEERQLPELNDTLAEQISDGQSTTLEDLRKAVSDRILENKKRAINNELRDKVINTVIEQSKITLHPTLIHEQIHDMMHQMEHMLERQGISIDQYLMITRQTKQQYEESLQPDAERSLKRQLVLDEVVRKEEISIAPEELESVFQAYAQLGQELPRTEEQVRALAMSYLREKAISRLVELTTDPDPDAESEAQTGEVAEQEAEAHAVAEVAADVVADAPVDATANAVANAAANAEAAALAAESASGATESEES